ncbi:MAG: hypothetical protein EOP49_11310 [Sphingobacteriales bacterium]|nr:MAG: hypothetical protein EOP49_11310 [Sphingobacteriales bacterium]
MIRPLLFLLCLIVVSGCNEVDNYLGREKKNVSYSYSCLDSAVGGKSLNRNLDKAGDFIRDVAVSEKSITDEIQTQYGEEFHKQMISEGSFKIVTDTKIQQRLDVVLKRLLGAREKPSSIGYKIFLLNDTTINAFTFGGRIYITRAMLKQCEGKDALLYAIVGHEIGHSETGHIKTTIQELELSDRLFGKNGATLFQIKQLLTASFNQRNELEADYYGINLTNALGYDVCSAVAFWKEMGSKENQYSEVEDFFRTHPFSQLRAQCLNNHISTNFGKECGDLNRSNLHPQVITNKKSGT